MLEPPLPEPAAPPGHRGTRAIQRLVEFAPSTGGLALWVHHRDVGDAVPTGAPGLAPAPLTTDGLTIHYHPAFASLPLPLQTGWVAHAVLHIALRHPQRFLDLQQRTGDVDLALFNGCADAIVNSALSHLAWLQLPPGAVLLPRLLASALGLNSTDDSALLAWDVEQLYRAIDDRQQNSPGSSGKRGAQGQAGGGGGRGAGPQQPGAAGSSAQANTPAAAAQAAPDPAAGQAPRQDGPRAARTRALLPAGQADLQPAPGQAGTPEAQAGLAREWRERLLRAHAGDGAFSLLRALVKDLPQARTPWEQVLRSQLARGLSSRPSLSWSRPSRSYLARQGHCGPGRRMPWEPGFSGHQPVPRLVVVVDVSGSVDNTLMGRFAGEIEAITRRLGASLLLVIGDDQVRRVQPCAPGRSPLREITFAGGGGTDFTPLLQEADRHRPDITVVLTDLAGPARFRPRWPVLWAVPEACADAVAPFGRKLVLA